MNDLVTLDFILPGILVVKFINMYVRLAMHGVMI